MLHVREAGAGPPILLLHGLLGSSANWQRIAAQLADRYRLIMPDLRGHGRSPKAGFLDYATMAADIEALLSALDLTSTVVVGHSLGGKAAMVLALTRPALVSRLVVVDIAPVAYQIERDHPVFAMRDLAPAALVSRDAADAALSLRIPQRQLRQFLLTNLERGDSGFRWRVDLDALAGALPALVAFPPLPGAVYDGPALFLDGSQSDYVSPAHEAVIAAYFPQARRETIVGAGHWLHVQQPDAFARSLRAFVG